MPEPQSSRLASGRLTRALWLTLAGICLVLGVVGLLLPVMPTTPFILLAAFAAARGSARLHAWLHNHPQFGPALRDWEREGAVSRRAKLVATIAMSCSTVVLFLISPRWWIAAVVSTAMLAVAVWLWFRPEPGLRAE